VSFYTKAILDVSSVGVPQEVKDEMRELWSEFELSNDYCYYAWDPELDEEQFPLIAEYIKNSGEDEENILIHFWW
jgi:hypothetical protein